LDYQIKKNSAQFIIKHDLTTYLITCLSNYRGGLIKNMTTHSSCANIHCYNIFTVHCTYGFSNELWNRQMIRMKWSIRKSTFA